MSNFTSHRNHKASRIGLAVATAILISALLAQLSLADTLAASPHGAAAAGQAVQQNGENKAAGRQQPYGPLSYTLQGNFDNTGTGVTTFTSSDTSGGGFGAWRFLATGAGEAALRARCSGGSGTCRGAYIEGEAHGIYSQSDNDSVTATSIGVYGLSLGRRGQGVAGVNNQTDGFGGVFTATGLYGIGLQATSRTDASIYAVSGNATTNPPFSIIGTALQGSTTTGVVGYGDKGSGVRGEIAGNSGGTAMSAGLFGQNKFTNGGLPASNAGVYGTCNLCNGVFGQTDSNIGVRGMAVTGTSSYGGYFTATLGTALYGKSASGVGVYGYSTSNYGLSGGSSSSYGVRGASTSSYGLYVTTETGPAAGYVKTSTGLVGLRAVNPSTAASHYAIVADGNVQVNGTLHATGGITAVSSTDQGDRQMYAGTSTQNLSSDQGTATLVNGRATIKIDPLFAQTVNLNNAYIVFLTPYSDATSGLAAVNLTPSSFEVRELNKGSGKFSFAWKIEAVRKGYEKERMEAAPAVPTDGSSLSSSLDKSELAPPEPSNSPPPVVPRRPGTTSGGALPVAEPAPDTSSPGDHK